MAARRLFLILIFVIGAVMVTACARDQDEDSAAPHNSASPALKPGSAKAVAVEISKDNVEVPRNSAPAAWLPQKVSLTCSLASCPPQVGVLIFTAPVSGTSFDIWRCSAFLIASDKIMTNGHCDLSDKAEGYFITRTDMPGKTFRRIGQRLFKVFTPSPGGGEVLSGRPDAAVFQLETPITNIQPLRLARGAPRAYSALTAIVVNSVAGKDSLTMSIGKLDCVMRRHERYFPIELDEAPDVLTAFECDAEKGNSGSPLFAEKSLEVEAILEGSKNIPELAMRIRNTQNRALLPYEYHKSIEATNLRCLEYPSPPAVKCLAVSEVEMQKRFSAKVDAAIAGLSKRSAPPEADAIAGFQTFRFELKSADMTAGSEFEILYFPVCKRQGVVKTLVMPMEHVLVGFDEWAAPRITSLGTTFSEGAIKTQNATGVTVDMKWAPAAGVYLNPQKDPRVQLGPSFSIALPACNG